MNADIKVKILGSEWSIKFGTSKTFEQLKNSDGYTDPSERIIIVDSMDEKKESDSVQNMSEYKKMILRHEILHAFLFESGLMHNSASTSSWATNEEMVDWFAIQSPKIFDLYSNLDLVPVNEYL